MAEETLLTASRRLIRMVRIDDAHHGGLLSLETVKAAEMLDIQVMRKEKKNKAREKKAPDQPAQVDTALS